jgi:osmotically-inducible protein OsmY
MSKSINNNSHRLLFGALILCSLSTYASPQQDLIDAKITSKINQKISAEKSISDLQVTVITNNNVKFSGSVNSVEDLHKIAETATPMNEVKNIDMNNLKIKK